jgi:ribosomal protein S8
MRQYFNNPIANCISSINLGYVAKQLFVELPVSRQLHSLLTTFVALGAIQSFSIKSPAYAIAQQSTARLRTSRQAHSTNAITGSTPKTRLQKFFVAQARLGVNTYPQQGAGYSFVVYLKYSEYTPVFSSIRNYWLARRKIIIPYSSLQVSRVQNTKQVFVLWTNYGFLTNTECLRLRIGGLLVCGLFAILCVFLHATL